MEGRARAWATPAAPGTLVPPLLNGEISMADISAQMFVQLYSKLAATFSVKATIGQDSQSMLSLMIPGLYINQHLDVREPRTQYYLCNALNPTLECSWLLRYGVGTVSDIYKSILDGKETPLVSLTPEQKKELDKAIAYISHPDGEPTEAYEQYRIYQLNYLQALDGYEQAVATEQNGGRKVPAEVKAALDRALEEWNRLGNKGDVERAIQIISDYESLEPATYWARLAERYRRWTRVADIDSEFQLLQSLPPYEEWFQEFGWTDFLLDDKDFAHQERCGAVGTGPDCSCCCPASSPSILPPSPLIVASPSGDFRRDAIPIEAEPVEFYAFCRLRRVEILRPWMNVDVFFSRAWRWSPASVSYGNAISTGGDIAGSVVPTGRLPILPTTAVLARDVEIWWRDDGTLAKALAEHVAAGHELAFGPFRLSRAVLEEGGPIKMLDPQLIGFLSRLIPRCPNPDPNLKWPLMRVDPSEFPRATSMAADGRLGFT